MSQPQSNHPLLNERQEHVLSAVVQNYVLTAEPVGSRTIAKESSMSLSAATIRNVMSDLEEMGLLEQPHTSAGRVPTDKGYRYYVDWLSNRAELSEQDKGTIDAAVAGKEEIEEVLEVASQSLGRVTRQLGVVLSPRFTQGVFKKLDFIPLSSNRILLALELESGTVKTMTVEMKTQLSEGELAMVCAVLNEKFRGLRIGEVQETLNERLSGAVIEEKHLGAIRLFIPSVEQLFETTGQAHLHAGGVPTALAQPEFLDRSLFSAIMELLENKKVLIHFLNKREQDKGVFITIGGENDEGQFKSFSVVTSNYHVGRMTGTLGVIGPTRMPYPKLISAVDYTAQVLERNQEGSSI